MSTFTLPYSRMYFPLSIPVSFKIVIENRLKVQYNIPRNTGHGEKRNYKVFLKSLRYVETFNCNLLLHTEQENIICYKSMKELEQELQDKGFIRCRTSYIVNFFYVKGVNKLEIELITGEIIPISQPKRKVFMEKLAEYWGDFI